MRKATFICCLVLIATLSAIAQNKKYLLPELNYTVDVVSNFSGGDKRTVHTMGLLETGFSFSSDSAKLWEGGLINFELISTHGEGISATTLHDLQGICNIEAGNNALLLWELWYYQQLGKFGVRAGLQNINSDFMNQPFTDSFSGGSYGLFPTLGLNYSLADYPVAGLGVSLSYQIDNNWSLLTSLFSGKVSGLEGKNRFNTHWDLNPAKDGILSISEIKYVSDSARFPVSIYGLGAVYHSKDFASIKDSSKSYSRNYTFYAFGEHDFYQTSTKTAGVFLQGSYAVKNRNMAYAYSGIGLVTNGFLTKSHNDTAGIGLSRLYYQSAENNSVRDRTESAVEIFVKYQIDKYFSIKPTFYTIISSPNRIATAGMIELGIKMF